MRALEYAARSEDFAFDCHGFPHYLSIVVSCTAMVRKLNPEASTKDA